MNRKLSLASLLLALVVAGTLWTLRGGRDGAERTLRTRLELPGAPLAPGSAELEAQVAERGAGREEARTSVAGAAAAESAEAPAPLPGWAPVHGRVVERHARTGLAGVRVELRARDGSGSATSSTDAEGRFRTQTALPPGELRVVCVDQGTGTTLRLDASGVTPERADGTPIEIVADTGPTIHLALQGPADPELEEATWRARIVESAPGELDRKWAWVPLRGEAEPWIRYPWRQSFEADSRFAPRLLVERQDGAWRGEVPLRTTLGLHPGIVAVPLSGLARLTGRVVDARGEGVEDAVLVLAPVGDESRGEEMDRWQEMLSARGGDFAFERLDAGAYRLTAKALHQPPVVRTLALHGGDNDAGDLAVATRPIAGDVRGRLLGRSGMPDPLALMRLRSLDGLGTDRWEMVGARTLRRGQEDGESAFVFADLPPGEYEITVFPEYGQVYAPASLVVSPPAQDVVFVRRDDLLRTQFGFHVRDAKTGEDLESFRVLLGGDEGWLTESRPARSGETVGEITEGAKLRWIVFAAGYRGAIGDESDFGARFTDEGSTRLAEVELSRGWGAALQLRDAGFLLDYPDASDHDGFNAAVCPPVVGARVLADGREVARSGSDGLARLALETEPARLEVRGDGWRLVGGDGFENGRLLEGETEAVLWLRRD